MTIENLKTDNWYYMQLFTYPQNGGVQCDYSVVFAATPSDAKQKVIDSKYRAIIKASNESYILSLYHKTYKIDAKKAVINNNYLN